MRGPCLAVAMRVSVYLTPLLTDFELITANKTHSLQTSKSAHAEVYKRLFLANYDESLEGLTSEDRFKNTCLFCEQNISFVVE